MMIRRLGTVLRVATVGMLAWAVVTELRKPVPERSWQGSLAGVVPYDLRRPTFARVRQRWWNAEDERSSPLTCSVSAGASTSLVRVTSFAGKPFAGKRRPSEAIPTQRARTRLPRSRSHPGPTDRLAGAPSRATRQARPARRGGG